MFTSASLRYVDTNVLRSEAIVKDSRKFSRDVTNVATAMISSYEIKNYQLETPDRAISDHRLSSIFVSLSSGVHRRLSLSFARSPFTSQHGEGFVHDE